MTRRDRNASMKISEALELLDEAAVDKKEEIQDLVNDGFHNLREAVTNIEPSVRRTINDSKAKISYMADRAKNKTVEKTREVSDTIDKEVHSNPWRYLGAAAGTGLLLGFLLGRRD